METILSLIARVVDLIRAGWNWLKSLLARLLALIDGSAAGNTLEAQEATSAPQNIPKSINIPSEQSTENSPDDALDEETALARMLASEDNNREGKIVVGWITLQRGKKTGLVKFITGGKGYGPQDRRKQGDGVVYASTAKPPKPEDREIARGLLNGTIQASAEIRKHKPGGWIERQMGVSDETIVDKQSAWKEGLYGQVAGTRWVLFSSDTQPVTPEPGQSASQLLDSLPIIPAVDRSTRRVA